MQATSLAHSLLLVSTSPVINVGVALVLRHAISAGEVAGALLAVGGALACWPYCSSCSSVYLSVSCCVAVGVVPTLVAVGERQAVSDCNSNCI
jgi:drug/metabolite transporter (DMT)-like permease